MATTDLYFKNLMFKINLHVLGGLKRAGNSNFRPNVRNGCTILSMNSSSLGNPKDLYQGNIEDFLSHYRCLAHFKANVDLCLILLLNFIVRTLQCAET